MAATTGGDLFGFEPDDVPSAVLPLFHVFGLSSILNTGVRFGGTIVLVPRFESEPVLDAMERHRVTLFLGVPTMYVALLQADTSSSRPLRAAGGRLRWRGDPRRGHPRLRGEVRRRDPRGLRPVGDLADRHVQRERRGPRPVDRPADWGVEVQVVDEDGVELERGENIGEIVIRGHNVMKGYYGRPEATARGDRDGWFHTGDLGYGDEDGYFFIVDRKKDLIIRGGFNVYPREIEEVLYAHPAVAEAAVIGKPDEPPRRGGRRRDQSSSPASRATPEEVVRLLQGAGWPPTSTRARSASSTSCRRAPPARSSSAR